MADYPAIPLFTDSYMRDCGHLTDAEHGRYFLLLMLMWQTPRCRIPNDPEWIARKLRRSVDAYYSEIEPLIKEFCNSTGNYLYQKRLQREYNYLKKTSKTQSERAKSKWKKKKDSSPRDPETVPDGSQTHAGSMPPTHTLPTPIISKDGEAKASLSSASDDVVVRTAFELFNEAAERHKWPRCQNINKTRRSRMQARLKEAGGLAGWEVALAKAEASPFCCGEVNGFRTTIDFLLQESSFAKLMEGNYDGRGKTQRQGGDTSADVIAILKGQRSH